MKFTLYYEDELDGELEPTGGKEWLAFVEEGLPLRSSGSGATPQEALSACLVAYRKAVRKHLKELP